MLLIYILPVYRLLSNLVSEKESRARESMKMMGLSNASYWLSWACYYFIIVSVISSLCIGVLSINVLKYSNKGLVFLIFWVFGLSLFGLVVFLSSFFSTARRASISGTLLYFGTSFLDRAVLDPNVGTGQKNAASLLTTVAIARISNTFGQLENSGVGLQTFNINKPYQNYAVDGGLIVMTISLFLFLFVGLYLDNVLPNSYGLRKHWCFCCLPSFCFRQDNPRRSQIDEEKAGGKIDEYFEAQNMNP